MEFDVSCSSVCVGLSSFCEASLSLKDWTISWQIERKIGKKLVEILQLDKTTQTSGWQENLGCCKPQVKNIFIITFDHSIWLAISLYCAGIFLVMEVSIAGLNYHCFGITIFLEANSSCPRAITVLQKQYCLPGMQINNCKSYYKSFPNNCLPLASSVFVLTWIPEC